MDVWEIGGDEKALDKPIERTKETTKAIANPAYFLWDNIRYLCISVYFKLYSRFVKS